MDQDLTQSRHRASAIAKATARLLPFLALAYMVNFLDRVNVGFAALHMNADLGLSPSVFGFGAGIFFVGYILCEIPSNLALQRFGARIWIARIMISWGVVACAMSLVSGATSFYVMRLLLGIAEAGFFPGIILYLTFWFPAAERARIIGMFMAAVPLATVIGGPVSGALLETHGFLGLAGWQWLFIVEGLPAILLGLAALKVLDDGPEHAGWLTPDERQALSATLAAEAETSRVAGYGDLRAAVTRPRVLALGLLYFLMVVGLYGIGFWMPQVIGSFGLAPLQVGFLTAIPYLFAAIAMVWWGRRSDRTGRAPLAHRAATAHGGGGFRLVGLFGTAHPHHGGADAGHARLLRRVRAILVAAHGAAIPRRRAGARGPHGAVFPGARDAAPVTIRTRASMRTARTRQLRSRMLEGFSVMALN